MTEPSLQLGNGNWAGKSGNLLAYHKSNNNFYADDLTFARASTGTIVNSDGLIEEVPWNLITYSEDFSNSSYIKDSGITIGTTNNVSPISNNTATQINVTNFGRIYKNVTSAEYRTSLYLKAGTFAYFKVVGQNVDLNLGTISSVYPADIEDVGNGWYRISISYITSIRPFQIQAFPDNTYSTHTTSGNYFVWGAMLNYGDTTKPYIKTTDRLNVPRVDYLNNSNGSLILEPQRSNLVPYSSDFSNAAWLKTSGVTVTSNYGISPDGKQNSTRLQFASNNEQVYDGIVHSGNTETASIYVKGQSGITMQFGVGSNISQGSTYTLTGEWQRLEHQSTSGSLFIIGNKDLTATDIEIYGAQLEQGSYPTSLIPTTGTTVTRIKDTSSTTGLSDVINSEEGVLFAEIAALYDDLTTRIISLSDGTNTNRIHLFYYSQSNDIAVNYRVSGSTVVSFVASLTDITNYSKVAFKWKSGDFKMYVDGNLIDSNTNTTMLPADTIDTLSFSRGDGFENFYGKVKNLQIFKTALTDTELATLTT